MKNILLISILSTLLFSCDDITNLKKDRRGGFNEEMRRNKIRKITEMQFIEMVQAKGIEITDTAQKLLSANLKQQIITNGTLEALTFCNINAYPLINEIAENYEVEIKRVSLKNRNQENKPNEMEKGILDAYQYNVDNKVDIAENIQKTKTGFLYTKPIFILDGLCLNCHGNELEIKEDVKNKLKELYPTDLALNYKLAELRGMWSVHFTRKTLTNMMYDFPN